MLRRLLQWTTALVLVCVFSGPADAQYKVKAPHVGQPAPAFNLKDINGTSVSLADYKGKKNVLLVIHRGWVGYW